MIFFLKSQGKNRKYWTPFIREIQILKVYHIEIWKMHPDE